MPNNFLIRRVDGHCDLAGSPRDMDRLCETLLPELTFLHVVHVRGRDRFTFNPSTGEREKRDVVFHPKRLYSIDREGRIVFTLGLLQRVTACIKRLGFTCEVQRHYSREELKRPDDIWRPNWQLLAKAGLTLREGQEEIIALMAATDRGFFDAGMGYGKSYVLPAVCLALHKVRFAIAVRGLSLVYDLHRDLSVHIPNVGIVSGKHRDVSRVTIYSLDSLHKYREHSADVLIVDEADEAGAEKHSATIERKFFDTKIFGLSATPDGRSDGTELRLEAMFGPLVFRMDSKACLEAGLTCPVEVRWIDNPTGPTLPASAEDNHELWMSALVYRNETRNQLLVEAARRHDDEQVLIIVQSAEHMAYLGKLLPDFVMVHRTIADDVLQDCIENGVLPEDYAPPSDSQLRDWQNKFKAGKLRAAIATDIWGRGVSFEGLRILVRGDPRRSSRKAAQIGGRLTRKHDGKSQALLYAVRDTFNERLKRWGQEQARVYRKQGWTETSAGIFLPSAAGRIVPADGTPRPHGRRR